MTSDSQHNVQQSMPLASLQHEAQLSIYRTYVAINDAIDGLFEPHDITTTQYNVLRILRGAEPAGLCRNELRDRMINRMPDVTRLLDRMEKASLIVRERQTEDRRMVRTRIAEAGTRILAALDDQMIQEQHRQFHDLDETELGTLIGLLGRVRQNV